MSSRFKGGQVRVSAVGGLPAEAATIAVERIEIQSSDPDSGVAIVKSSVIEHRARIRVRSPGQVRVEVRSATSDGFGVDLLRFSGIGYQAEGGQSDCVVAGVLVAGRGRLSDAGEQVSLTAGGVCLAPMDSHWVASMEDLVYSVVRFPLSDLVEHAGEFCELSEPRVRFHGIAPLAGTERSWTHTSTFLHRQLVDSRIDRINPLALHGLKRLTATALLTTFPNTTMTSSYTPGPGRTTPPVIRRATQFIDEHAAEPLTLAQIAAAVRVSPRSLQAGFRRHLDTTPLTYLRRVRLANAHRDLRAADPTRGDTVERIAARWGFIHPARFSSWYREAYGVLPSRTLRD